MSALRSRTLLWSLVALWFFSVPAFAAWDSTKPAQTQTVSAGQASAQGNFAAIEAGTATVPGTTSSAFAISEGGNISGCTTNKLADDGACFEGDTADGIETKLVITDPTASDKTLTVPNANSVTLPTGAAFFMITGSCPAGTTDVTATYSDRFIRINATGGTTAGTNSHTHADGSYATATHDHGAVTGTPSGSTADLQGVGGGWTTNAATHTHSVASQAALDVTGASGTQSDVPVTYVTAKLCQVD